MALCGAVNASSTQPWAGFVLSASIELRAIVDSLVALDSANTSTSVRRTSSFLVTSPPDGRHRRHGQAVHASTF